MRAIALLITATLSGALLTMNDAAAQSKEELDAATAAANIAEQQKKAAEARKAAAVADAEAAAAASKAANDLAKNKADSDKAKADADKAKADADKAQIDSVKAGLPTPPDPAKYKLEKPTAPVLNATVSRMTFQQAEQLAKKLGPKIAAAATGKIVLTDDAKVRTLMTLATATKESLITARSGVEDQTKALTDRQSDRPVTAFSAGTAVVIGSLLETVLSYATILRTQYGFATASATTNAEAMLTALVLEQLVGSDKLVTNVDADGALPQANSAVSAELDRLRKAMDAARKVVGNTANWSKARREAVPTGATDAEKAASRAANAKAADQAERMAEALSKSLDEAQKLVAALFVVDAQGNTPFDGAQRGEALAATLSTSKEKVTLTVKVIASDADTVATDRWFEGLKVFIGNTTVARWKLVDSTGKVVGAGAVMDEKGPQRITLKDSNAGASP